MKNRVCSRAAHTLMLVIAVMPSAIAGCGDSASTEKPQISTEKEAQAAFLSLKSLAEEVDRQVHKDFTAPLSISGAAGTASVSGKKTSSSSTSSNSTSSTKNTDIIIRFAEFKTNADSASASGDVRWFEGYSSRTACSESQCASASDHSEALEASSIKIVFLYEGRTYSDQINIDASSDKDSERWDVKVTNGAGNSFKFVYR